jgi:hypothetical protein
LNRRAVLKRSAGLCREIENGLKLRRKFPGIAAGALQLVNQPPPPIGNLLALGFKLRVREKIAQPQGEQRVEFACRIRDGLL